MYRNLVNAGYYANVPYILPYAPGDTMLLFSCCAKGNVGSI